MIDARRMEVFTAMYDSNLKESIPPSALILDDNTFADTLKNNRIYFTGSGSLKFQHICKHVNAKFIQSNNLKISMSAMSRIMFDINLFNDIALVEPDYLKAYKAF
jgi:tRNA threonylcarbamoyladenosine biosynthesis protein TsaB